MQLYKYFSLILAAMIIFMSCAVSKYQKAEILYAEDAFEQLIRADFDCQENSTPCFRLKYVQMESYIQLGDWQNAIVKSRDAIERVNPDIHLDQVNRVYQVQIDRVFETMSELESREEKTGRLRILESDMYSAIELNRDSANTEKVSEYQLMLTRILLLKMDFHESKNLEIIHEDIMDVVSEYDKQLKSQGYDVYYLLQADLKLYLPEIRDWIYKGKISRNREELLIQLKDIYKDALNLRKIPLYQQGFSEEIEGQLKEIDEYMKQLII
jgi:hypothetical protein